MMHQKAILFSDAKIANEIIESNDPSEQKGLGKKVKGFSDTVWNKNREAIVFDGNIAKFSQNKGLRRKLFQTGTSILVEASPIDTIWGIGVDAETAKKITPAQWHGQNLLGRCLTKVRDKLKTQFEIEANAVELSEQIWLFDESRT